MGESTQSMRPARCRSPRLANHHIWSVSGGRGPQHGRNDRGPRRVGTRPPSPGLRPFLAHGIPRNIRSSRRQPAAAESRVSSFETMPFKPRIVPALAVVQTVADRIIRCTRDASRPLKRAAARRMQKFQVGSGILRPGNGGDCDYRDDENSWPQSKSQGTGGDGMDAAGRHGVLWP